ncbi:MAG TPA: GlsB/YeaQ/YmgE family stress response membrane protein [Candidatus Binatia bacterium]|nr:GlsB/YeaQ/YmgE family stress response membrane protein [Candidatus Binatia bacterium]
MHWLWVVLIGLIVGALAKLIMPGKDPGGFIVTILLGIAGSVLGTLIGRAVGWYQEGQSAGFIVSLLGALLILAVYHFFRKRAA